MVGASVAHERMSEGSRRFFSRLAQLVFWIVVVALIGYLLRPGAEHVGLRWWPFQETPRAAVVEAPPPTSPPGWTDAAKAALPAVVNVATVRRGALPTIRSSGCSSAATGCPGANMGWARAA